MRVAVIGGGAAGFFAAINVKQNYPDAEVLLLEKSNKILSKVRVSGGGRCNVTNGCESRKKFISAYPRGSKLMKKGFNHFDNHSIISWFEERGVKLKTENDNRVFPVSDNSESIIDCLTEEAKRLGCQVLMKHQVLSISIKGESHILEIKNADPIEVEKTIIASGGSPKRDGLSWLEELGHMIVDPVPSLFTFNMPGDPIIQLQGLVASNSIARIQGSKIVSEGPILITHWGMSGPCILKLSSLGARYLYETNYQFNVQINWVNIQNSNDVFAQLEQFVVLHPKKKILNVKVFDLPSRLWEFLLAKCDIPTDKIWAELGKKRLHKITDILCNDIYPVSGKTTFKEEFVTCGGVDLASINQNTLASKAIPNLYFAGEVLDIDGITGGYNFQAAWTTAYIAGKLL